MPPLTPCCPLARACRLTPEKEVGVDLRQGGAIPGNSIDGVHRVRVRSASGEVVVVLGLESVEQQQVRRRRRAVGEREVGRMGRPSGRTRRYPMECHAV